MHCRFATCSRSVEGAEQPVALLLAKLGPAGIVRRLFERLVAAAARVDQEQLRGATRFTERNTRVGSLGSGRRSGSHSDLTRRTVRSPLFPRAVALGFVFGRAAAPRAICELVVVDGPDQRMGVMHGLGVGISAVLRVSSPVVSERPALVQGLERPSDICARSLAGRWVLCGLVDVVAEVQDEVEVVARRDPCVTVEEAGVELGARHDCETDVIGCVGKGLERADWRSSGRPSGSRTSNGCLVEARDIYPRGVVGNPALAVARRSIRRPSNPDRGDTPRQLL